MAADDLARQGYIDYVEPDKLGPCMFRVNQQFSICIHETSNWDKQ